MVAGTAGIALGGAVAGVFWLFVYGDNQWPDYTGGVVVVTALIAAVLVFSGLSVVSYYYGKHRESKGGLSAQHAVLAVAVTILMTFLFVLRQCAVGG